MIQISVVIPSYNQPDTISQCLESVLKQDFTGVYEVVIVDSSIAKYQEIIAGICEVDERVRLIKLKQQTYPGAARNVGIKEAKGEVIALIDSDCVAHESWLSNIAKNMEENIIATGVIENGTQDSVYGTCSFLVEFNHFLAPSQHKKEVHAAATCNFAAKKEVFEKVGYFTDDRAFEDMLFCTKFKKMGGAIYQFRDIRISHVNKTDLKKIAANQKMLGFYSAKVRKQHQMPPQAVFNYPVLAFGLLGFRYLSILSRVIKSKHFLSFVLYNPIIIYLLIQWSIGFYNGAKEQA